MSRRLGALRRRRKPSLATRLRIAWIFIVVFVGLAGYGGYVIVTLPALRVNTIDVEIDGLAVKESEVLRAARIDHRSNVWLLNTQQIARRIEAIPYVDVADIRRRPLADLRIDVTEREPVACVRSGTRVVTIDRRRRILQDDCARPSAVAIELRQGTLGAVGSIAAVSTLAALLADSQALSNAHVGIRSMHDDAYGGIVAVNDRGTELLFGTDANLDQKVKLVAPVLAAIVPGRSIKSVDLRIPATPTVQFR